MGGSLRQRGFITLFYTKTPPASHFSSDLPQFGGKTSTVKTSFLITTSILPLYAKELFHENIRSGLIWLLVALVGAFAFAMLALSRGEHVNAVWLVVAAVACYSIAYRFYSRFIADKVFELDDRRLTPAERHNDGLDYVPTNKWVLFGHHFAAIAGAGPLVGPILAAQMGFLPGTI